MQLHLCVSSCVSRIVINREFIEKRGYSVIWIKDLEVETKLLNIGGNILVTLLCLSL